MNRKFIIKSLVIICTVLIGTVVFFVISPEASAHPTQYAEWSGTNPASAGGLQTVPDGFGLTAIAYGSDDDRCSVFIRTAPVDSNGLVDFTAVSFYQTTICPSGGGDDGNPGPRVEPIPDHYTTGWTWGAATGGGHSGDSSFPPDECYYQEYAPLNDINNRTGWGAAFDGTCNERGYLPGWIRGKITAPLGQVIVAVGISLANDANVSMVGMNTSHIPSIGTISADPNPIQVCSPDTTGVTTLSGFANVGWEIRLNSPTIGQLFASGVSGNYTVTSGDQVTDGMTFYLLEGGTSNVLDSIMVTHTAAGCPTLSVSLSANPSFGTAPLNGVDLTADVEGSAVGDIRYRFDCTNDGTYEHDVTNALEPYTAIDLCNYPSAGIYTVHALVDRQGVSTEATTTVNVSSVLPKTITADLVANDESDDDVTITAGGNVRYSWTSSANATSGSSTLTISPTSPDPCGNTNSNNWTITGTGGNIPPTPTCATAGGFTYTITYNVTGPGGSASDTVIVRLVAAPVPTPVPLTLTCSPSTGISMPGGKVTFTASGGQAPYFWSVGPPFNYSDWQAPFLTLQVPVGGEGQQWIINLKDNVGVKTNCILQGGQKTVNLGNIIMQAFPNPVNSGQTETVAYQLIGSETPSECKMGSVGLVTGLPNPNWNGSKFGAFAWSENKSFALAETTGFSVACFPPTGSTGSNVFGNITVTVIPANFKVFISPPSLAPQKGDTAIFKVWLDCSNFPDWVFNNYTLTYKLNGLVSGASQQTFPSLTCGNNSSANAVSVPVSTAGVPDSELGKTYQVSAQAKSPVDNAVAYSLNNTDFRFTNLTVLDGGPTSFSISVSASCIPSGGNFNMPASFFDNSVIEDGFHVWTSYQGMPSGGPSLDYGGRTYTLLSSLPANGFQDITPGHWNEIDEWVPPVDNGWVNSTSSDTGPVNFNIFNPAAVGKSAYYVVTFYKGSNESTPSNVYGPVLQQACSSPPSASSVTVTESDYCVSGPGATVSWVYSDPEGQPQSAFQVQVDDLASFNSPEFDSNKVSSGGTSYFANNLPFDKTLKARVRVWDSQNSVSNWSVSSSWKTPKHAYPKVNFSWSPLQPAVNQSVQFTDTTQFFDAGGVGQRAWSWLFKAPAPTPSSTLQNPAYTYTTTGTYNITETVTDKDGYVCALTKPIGIEKPIPVWEEVSPK
ncbi:MAG: hypothetical protein HYX20_01005 [Candidatus Yanofskybacteria bacterium]|nr:hypothetical protein [Candidatus Yanofskybacteria bacterium]